MAAPVVPQASAIVRTAPFITWMRTPSCSTVAAVRRVVASKGAKEIGVTRGRPSKAWRVRAASRNARSIGSWSTSCEASAPTRSTSNSVASAKGDHAGHGEPIHRDRAGLVDTQHVRRRDVIGCAETRQEHAPPSQLFRTDRHAHAQHDGERDRHRAHEQNEEQRYDGQQGLTTNQRQHHHESEQRAHDGEAPHHDLRDDRLDVHLRPCLGDQRRGPAEGRLRAGQQDETISFAPPHDRPG